MGRVGRGEESVIGWTIQKFIKSGSLYLRERKGYRITIYISTSVGWSARKGPKESPLRVAGEFSMDKVNVGTKIVKNKRKLTYQ